MNFDEITEVLVRISEKRKKPVDKALLKEIVALVVKHPLIDDRGQCQDQIQELIAQRVKGKTDAD